MNENMVNVLKKINEMQMKLNIINENIEEIKNDRKNLEEKEKSKKSKSIYTKHNSLKNHHQNITNIEKDIDNNPNLNFIYKKNINNSSKHINFNSNKTSSYSNNKEKNSKYNNSQIYDEYELKEADDNNKANDNTSQANILDKNFGNKKNRYFKKSRTSLSSFDNNCDKNSFFEQNEYNYDHNHNHLNQTKDYFYKKSMSKNNCYYMKKGLNCSDFNKIKDNNSEMKLYTTKNQIKMKKIINQKNSFCCNNRINENIMKDIKYNNCNRNVYNNIINNKKKMIFRTNKNFFINDNICKKTIDLEQNYSHDKENFNRNYIYENNKNDYMTVKNKTRNNNFHNLNYINNNVNNNSNEKKIYFKKRKDSEHISDDPNHSIKSKYKRCFSIDDQRIKYNENQKKYEPKLAQTISPTIYSTKSKNPKINHHNNNINNSNNHIHNSHNKKGKEINYEQILLDIIDITNQYNNHEGKINVDNVIDEYKMLLRNIKIKNVFIYNLINMYNNSTKSNLNCREPKSLVSIWNWIISNQNKNKDNYYLKNEDIQYRRLCQEIMKQYNIRNIQQLKMFINNSFRKINNNDNFLEGIKKILLE